MRGSRPARRSGMSARVRRNGASRFTSSVLSSVPSGSSSKPTGPSVMMAALLTSTSRAPQRSAICSAARAAEQIAERWGALDVLVNNAAIMTEGPVGFDDEPDGTLERTLDVNLLAPFRLTRALIPLLRAGREPRIVHVTSGAGTLAGLDEPGISSYRLSKWALNGLERLQAQHLNSANAVNGLDPGWVKTDLGGPRAPGVPEDSARGALALLLEPFETTGKLFKDCLLYTSPSPR